MEASVDEVPGPAGVKAGHLLHQPLLLGPVAVLVLLGGLEVGHSQAIVNLALVKIVQSDDSIERIDQ